MKSSCAIAKLVLLLILPTGLFAQPEPSKVELPFDKAYFEKQNYFMLNMFASEIVVSPLMTNFIYVSNDYGIGGNSDKASSESLVVKEIYELKDAQSAELQEKLVLKQGEEVLDYFLENLNFESFISFRVAAIDKVEVKRYALIPKSE